jgi:hypothetical protein
MSVIKELDLQSLIQIFLTPRLRGDRAMNPASLLVDLFELVLLLHLLSTALELCRAIHASGHHGWVVGNGLVLPHVLLVYQMIGCGYRVVPIGLDALDGILVFEFVLFLHDLEDGFVVWHFLLAWEEAADAFFF